MRMHFDKWMSAFSAVFCAISYSEQVLHVTIVYNYVAMIRQSQTHTIQPLNSYSTITVSKGDHDYYLIHLLKEGSITDYVTATPFPPFFF